MFYYLLDVVLICFGFFAFGHLGAESGRVWKYQEIWVFSFFCMCIILIFFKLFSVIFPNGRGLREKNRSRTATAAANFTLWDYILIQCQSVLLAATVAQAGCYKSPKSHAFLFHSLPFDLVESDRDLDMCSVLPDSSEKYRTVNRWQGLSMAITQKFSFITVSGNCSHYGGQFVPFFTECIFSKLFQDIANLIEALQQRGKKQYLTVLC